MNNKIITIAFGLCFASAMLAAPRAQQLSGGGGGVPGGATTQVQFNDAGVFNGNSAVVINKTNNILAFGGVTSSFPGIKSSASALGLDRLAVRLADDSAFGFIATSGLELMNGATRTGLVFQSGGNFVIASATGAAQLILDGQATGGNGQVLTTGITGQTVQAMSTIANGANNNVTLSQSWARITGPTGAFSISGFTAGFVGAKIFLFNTTAQAMTITNEGASSTAANRITTLTGADVVLAASVSSAIFTYDVTSARWILMSARDSAGAK